jgi:phosphoribosylformylglycinamidine synthase
LAPLDLDVERRVQQACRAAIGAGLVRSAHDVAEGGVAVALAEACVSGPALIGAAVDLPVGSTAHVALFGEGPSRIVVSVPPEAERHFEQLMTEFRVAWRWIGRVGGDRLSIGSAGTSVIDLDLRDAAEAWRNGFARHVS